MCALIWVVARYMLSGKARKSISETSTSRKHESLRIMVSHSAEAPFAGGCIAGSLFSANLTQSTGTLTFV